jgi:hypothetical protein
MSKNQVGKSNSQMLLSISFLCVLFVLQNVFENDSFNKNITYRILILSGCWDKTKTGGISS